MNFKKISFLISFLCMVVFARAQTTDNFTASHLKAAESMLLATEINTQFDAIYDNVITAFSANIPEANKAKFAVVMRKFLTKYMSWDALKEDFTKIYAGEFSEQELNQLAQFYNTPLGKKLSSKLPALQQKGMLLGQQRVQAHQAELQEEFAKDQ